MDKTSKDVCYNNIPFGKKLIILGGDFRQMLPVVKTTANWNSRMLSQRVSLIFLWHFFIEHLN